MRASGAAALAVASLASFLTPFMGAATNVALPAIARELRADPIELTWVSAAYLLAAAACLVPLGRLADLHGRKRMFATGLLLYTGTSWLCAEASTIEALIAGRALQGISGAMIFGTSVAILTSIFPPARRGMVLGLNAAAVYVGLSLGPFAGGLMVDHYGWRSIFAVNVPLGAMAYLLTLWKLKGDWAEAKGAPFDALGSALYGVALTAMMYGASRLPELRGVFLIAAGLALLGFFVRRELSIGSPVLDVGLFARNRVFAMGSLAALINYSATFAVGFLLSLYLQYVRAFTAQYAGTILVSQPIVMAIVSPFAGRLSDRAAPRIVASAGMAMVAVGLFLLAVIGPRTPIPAIVGALLVLGCGFGLFSSPNTNAVMGAVDPPQYGVASALLATMRLTGQMMSMAVAMLTLAAFVGREPLTTAHQAGLNDGLRVAFLVFGVFCTAGVFASLARGTAPRPRNVPETPSL